MQAFDHSVPGAISITPVPEFQHAAPDILEDMTVSTCRNCGSAVTAEVSDVPFPDQVPVHDSLGTGAL